jgi:hypothetical protein
VQLENKLPALKSHICDDIDQHNNITDLIFRDQWKYLIIQPLFTFNTGSFQPPLLLVIDVLDKCENKRDIQ